MKKDGIGEQEVDRVTATSGHASHPAPTRARWILAASTLAVIAACSRDSVAAERDALEPLEGLVQSLEVSRPGENSVSFTFENTTDTAWRVPEIRPDCACLRCSFRGETIEVGATGILDVRLTVAERSGGAHRILLVWPNGRRQVLGLVYTATGLAGIFPSPDRVDLSSWRDRGVLSLSLVIDFGVAVTAKALRTLSIRHGRTPLAFEVKDIEHLNPRTVRMAVDIPWQIEDPGGSLSLHAAGLQVKKIVMHP